MVEKICGLYCITHTASGKRYVGKSVDVLDRIAHHSQGRAANGMYVAKAIKKYGWGAFTWEILERCPNDDVAMARERHWISELGTRAPAGYNLTDGGDGVAGLKFSDESKKRLRDSHLGIGHSFETREKMSASKKGQVISEKQRGAAREWWAAQSPEWKTEKAKRNWETIRAKAARKAELAADFARELLNEDMGC